MKFKELLELTGKYNKISLYLVSPQGSKPIAEPDWIEDIPKEQLEPYLDYFVIDVGAETDFKET